MRYCNTTNDSMAVAIHEAYAKVTSVRSARLSPPPKSALLIRRTAQLGVAAYMEVPLRMMLHLLNPRLIGLLSELLQLQPDDANDQPAPDHDQQRHQLQVVADVLLDWERTKAVLVANDGVAGDEILQFMTVRLEQLHRSLLATGFDPRDVDGFVELLDDDRALRSEMAAIAREAHWGFLEADVGDPPPVERIRDGTGGEPKRRRRLDRACWRARSLAPPMNAQGGTVLSHNSLASHVWQHALAEPGEFIKIAIDAEFGIPNSTSAQAVRNGAVIAADEINANRGVLGRKLTIIERDNRAVPARSLNNLRELATDPDVVAVMCARYSPVVVEILPEIHRLGMILLDPWAAADSITEHSFSPSYVFRVSLSDSLALQVAMRYGQKISARKIGLLLSNTEWGRSSLKAAESTASRFTRQEIVATQWYNWGDASLIAQYHTLGKAGAEAVVFIANDREAIILVKELAAVPAERRLPIISHWGITGGRFVDLAGPAREAEDGAGQQRHRRHQRGRAGDAEFAPGVRKGQGQEGVRPDHLRPRRGHQGDGRTRQENHFARGPSGAGEGRRRACHLRQAPGRVPEADGRGQGRRGEGADAFEDPCRNEVIKCQSQLMVKAGTDAEETVSSGLLEILSWSLELGQHERLWRRIEWD